MCLANCYGELILPVIALRKWAESRFRDAPNGSETIGAAKHAPHGETPNDFIGSFAEVDRIPQRARVFEKSGSHRCLI